MIKTDFLPIDYSYFDYEGKNYIKIIGRNNSGKRICLIDTCPVYLWAIVKDEVKKSEVDLLIEKISKINLDIKGRKTKVEKVELHKKKFLGQPVNALKIFATNYKDLHDIADELGFPEIKYRRGYDLGFVTHYIIESKILPLQWYEIEGEILQNSLEFGGIDSTLDVDMCIKVSSVKKIKEKNFIPKVLAFDIETEEFQIGKGKILMISLVSKNFKKVITIKKPKRNINLDFVEYVKDEISLIKKFVEYTKKISPDFLVGYFSDGFDMAYIKARADINKIKLPLGLDNSQPIFYKGAVITCRINGIVHIDLLKFIDSAYSQYMQSETLSLNDVSWEFLNERKKDFEFKSLRNMSDNDWKNYFEYNLQDSDLTYKLFLKLWPDIMAFSKVIQEPVFEISRNGMSKNVESFILHNLERFNEIPERRPTNDEVKERMRLEKYEGAFVFQPTPGLYENIAVFDFTSSYGSTIVTYNLSKSTYIENPNQIKSEKEVYSIEVLGKKVYFTKKPGFFPEMLKEIILLRKKYKQELKNKDDALTAARSNAFKLLANASYGYQGFFGARYYCREAAAATAAFARKAIQNSIKA
ncbi:MAG: 3'-5' exonuclease, partial [Candidatus Pacearchaeota archaeon]